MEIKRYKIQIRIRMKDSIASDGHDMVFVNTSRSQIFRYEVENCQSYNNSNDVSDYLHTRVSITSSIGSDVTLYYYTSISTM